MAKHGHIWNVWYNNSSLDVETVLVDLDFLFNVSECILNVLMNIALLL